MKNALFFIYIFLAITQVFASTDTWRGLIISDERRCSPYNRAKDYSYPQSIETQIVKSMDNKIYSPYTDVYFESTDQTDIDHIVSLSEAHDSGLCASDQSTKSKFASDVQNLTLASPHLNRHIKSSSDVAEWLPDKNKCWFVNKVLSIKRNYSLTVDSDELIALEKVLSNCTTSKISHTQPGTDHRLTATLEHNKNTSFPTVKKSISGICHLRDSSKFYHRTKRFYAFDNLKSCLDSGGRCPKKMTPNAPQFNYQATKTRTIHKILKHRTHPT